MPGFFGDQAERLRRDDWDEPGTQRLAEELWAMFGADKPMTTDQPITITRDVPGPVIHVIDNTDGTTDPIQVTRAGDTNNYTTTQQIQQIVQQQQSQVGYTPKSGCYPGVILRGGGGSYDVQVYPYGPGDTSIVVTVPQLQIDPQFSIPAGTWTLVGFTEKPLNDSPQTSADVVRSYYMQVPVWLPRPT